MVFSYKTLEQDGTNKEGTIDALSIDAAINSLQRRGSIITSIKPLNQKGSLFKKNITFFSGVSVRDIVILSRQMSILFESQVSANRIFRLLAAENGNATLRLILAMVADDIQGGSAISVALSRHPKVFTSFYTNMIKAGEESGKMNETLMYLADYLDRTYEVTSKTRNALIYPAFIIFTFITVMVLMFTMVIPKISVILTESGQSIPFYTQIILVISSFLVEYGVFVLIAVALLVLLFVRYVTTTVGRRWFDRFKLDIPYIGELYRKLFLSRIADNMNTMITAGIPMLRTLEITSNVIGSVIFKEILDDSITMVKGGVPVSDAFSKYPDVPGIMVQMMRVGEETGELGKILKTLARFYQREVTNAVDTLIGLIEPVMIVSLGVGVGILLAAILVPIYDIASSF